MRFVYRECQNIRRFWSGKYDFEFLSWIMVAALTLLSRVRAIMSTNPADVIKSE